MNDRAVINGKRAFDLQDERDALAAQLAELQAKYAFRGTVIVGMEALGVKDYERIERLERALVYAKQVLREWSITQSKELERLERGE